MSSNEIFDLLDELFRQAKMAYGRSVRFKWFYDGDGCPGCGSEIKTMKLKKKNALSINAYTFREYGVLIGYLLCGKCARHIFVESEANPYMKLPIYGEIEKNLKQAYLKRQGH